jgi:molybdenum cofactor biosynthesis enzyme MoaA
MMMMMMMIISVQIGGYLITCGLNSVSANYKAMTETHTKQNSANTRIQDTNKRKPKHYAPQSSMRSTGAKTVCSAKQYEKYWDKNMDKLI